MNVSKCVIVDNVKFFKIYLVIIKIREACSTILSIHQHLCFVCTMNEDNVESGNYSTYAYFYVNKQIFFIFTFLVFGLLDDGMAGVASVIPFSEETPPKLSFSVFTEKFCHITLVYIGLNS